MLVEALPEERQTVKDLILARAAAALEALVETQILVLVGEVKAATGLHTALVALQLGMLEGVEVDSKETNHPHYS